jgi:hypothetical protein
MAERSTETLLELCSNLEALKESFEALDEFQTFATKTAHKYHAAALKEIQVEMANVLKRTGYDWSGYLDDLSFDDLAEGGFYEMIQRTIIKDISEESSKF